MKVVLDGEKVLREKAQEVNIPDVKKGLYRAIVSSMQDTLTHCHDGVALAAPQVGESIRLFVVSPKVFEESESRKSKVESSNAKVSKDKDFQLYGLDELSTKHLVYFNPVIKKVSSVKKDLDEGCLSVNGLYGKVPRSTKALIEAYDEYGMKFTRGASGLLAQIFQHEVDHLDGILYTDKASELKELESRQTKNEQ